MQGTIQPLRPGPTPDHARSTYEVLAPFYDDFTANHDHATWTDRLERLARQAGLSGSRILDVACGTGKSLAPFLERGWSGAGTDVSPAMVEHASRRLGERADVHVADMRELPVIGEFDLITCLTDALNCLCEPGELEATLAGFERNLAPGGVVLFDVNSLATFRLVYSSVMVAPGDDRVVVLEGNGSRELGENGTANVEFITYTRNEDGFTWTRAQTRSYHRHHSEAVVLRALAAAGFGWVSLCGQDTQGVFQDDFDELRDSKGVYVARREPPS